MSISDEQLARFHDAARTQIEREAPLLSEEFLKRLERGDYTAGPTVRHLIRALVAEAARAGAVGAHEQGTLAAYWLAGGAVDKSPSILDIVLRGPAGRFLR